MTQFATFRSLFRTLPGHMYSPPQERETESLCSPFVAQQLTITLAGADPFVAEATLTIVFPGPGGTDITVGPITIPDTSTLAEATDIVAAAWPSYAGGFLYSATSDGVDTITLVAKSATTSIPAASFVETFSDAHTAVTAQTVASAAASLAMGLFYRYLTPANPLAIIGTPRGCRVAALPTGSSVIADLAGVIAREPNSTTLDASFLDYNTFDSYPAGRVWPGLKRGEVCVRVDPASPTMTDSLTQQVHVVIATGAYTLVGGVAGAADGGNTIRIDNAPTGNILARTTAREETFSPFAGYTGRCIPLRVNRTA